MADRMTTLATRQPVFLDPDPGRSRRPFLRAGRKPVSRLLRSVPHLAAGIVVGAVLATGAYLAVSAQLQSDSPQIRASSVEPLNQGAKSAIR